VSYAAQLIETEMNGVTDNPLTFPDSTGDGAAPCVLHGGNFQGQQVAFAADALNAAITQTGLLVERQIDALLNPSVNDNAPLLLAWSPGVDSGLAGAQLTATAAAAELRAQAQMHATATIPTNGGNQDIVSMGTMAARRAFDQTNHCAVILAVAGLALHQLTFLRREGRAPGMAVEVPDWIPPLEPLRGDRALHDEIASLADAWLVPNW
jgi:histidine ammonia-lyase/tyrosine ammonia-lyase